MKPKVDNYYRKKKKKKRQLFNQHLPLHFSATLLHKSTSPTQMSQMVDASTSHF